jgi:hypothetical protein
LENIMTTLVVQHSVADFDTWKTSFDAHSSIRAGHGATSHRVLHDGNDVIVLIEFPDAVSVEAFATDPSLAEAMKNGGVVSAPQRSVVEEAEVVTY